jgi:hypothetical protein
VIAGTVLTRMMGKGLFVLRDRIDLRILFGIVRYHCVMKNEETKLCARTNDHHVCGRPKHVGKALIERVIKKHQRTRESLKNQPYQNFASYGPTDDPRC